MRYAALLIYVLSVHACLRGSRPTSVLSPDVDRRTVKYWKAVIEVPDSGDDDPGGVEDDEGRIDNVDGFILDEMYLYHNVDVKYTQVKTPLIHLINKQGGVVETADIYGCGIQDIEQLLLYRGFHKKFDLQDRIPDEYLDDEWPPSEDVDRYT